MNQEGSNHGASTAAGSLELCMFRGEEATGLQNVNHELPAVLFDNYNVGMPHYKQL